jgi:hypothetical protein
MVSIASRLAVGALPVSGGVATTEGMPMVPGRAGTWLGHAGRECVARSCRRRGRPWSRQRDPDIPARRRRC